MERISAPSTEDNNEEYIVGHAVMDLHVPGKVYLWEKVSPVFFLRFRKRLHRIRVKLIKRFIQVNLLTQDKPA